MGYCGDDQSRKCSRDSDCLISVELSPLELGDGICRGDYEHFCNAKIPSMCETYASGEKVDIGPCLVGKKYVGPCEGVSKLWTGVGTDLQEFDVCQPAEISETLLIAG